MSEFYVSPTEQFHYKGYFGCASVCGLTLVEGEGCLLVVWTELQENKGTSVTNAAELLATQLLQSHPLVRKYAPDHIYFIEHYSLPDSTPDDTLDLVELTWDTRRGAFQSPRWTRLKNVAKNDSTRILFLLLDALPRLH